MSGKVGRPPLGEDVVGMTFLLPRALRERLKRAAKRAKYDSLSDWARDMLAEKADEILG